MCYITDNDIMLFLKLYILIYSMRNKNQYQFAVFLVLFLVSSADNITAFKTFSILHNIMMLQRIRCNCHCNMMLHYYFHYI